MRQNAIRRRFMLISFPPTALLYLAVVHMSDIDSVATETARPATQHIWEAARNTTDIAVSRCELYRSLDYA